MDYHYHAIVLGKKDVGEADRLYTLYTRETGKIKVMAKGVRKVGAKLSGFLEPVTEVEVFVARTKGTGKVTGALANQYFFKIKNNWESLREVFFVFSRLQKIVTGEAEDQKLFLLLKEFLETLEENVARPLAAKKMVALGFLLQLFEHSGYHLEAEKCVVCGARLKSGEHFFSAARSGVLCGSCRSQDPKALRATANAVKIIRLISRNALKHLPKITADLADVENAAKIIEQNVRWISN